MRLRLYGAIFGIVAGAVLRFWGSGAGAFSRCGTADGAELYNAYRAQDGRVVHMIMSDNATPDDMFDDWLVDWEYID